MAAEPTVSVVQRSVKELLDRNVPYSDMTEEEIAAIVDYKVAAKVSSSLYNDSISIMLDEAKSRNDIVKSSSDALNKATNEMLERLCSKIDSLRG